MKMYHYVGPHALADQRDYPSPRACIRQPADVIAWVAAAQPSWEREDEIVVTFVIDADGDLWIADRRSEHVQCARGGDVLSAGEMTFAFAGGKVVVSDVSNQSTGYCPEMESWPVVAAALERAGMAHPGCFTLEIVFRRCETCGGTNIVKDGWFECAVCGSGLSEEWNFGPQ